MRSLAAGEIPHALQRGRHADGHRGDDPEHVSAAAAAARTAEQGVLDGRTEGELPREGAHEHDDDEEQEKSCRGSSERRFDESEATSEPSEPDHHRQRQPASGPAWIDLDDPAEVPHRLHGEVDGVELELDVRVVEVLHELVDAIDVREPPSIEHEGQLADALHRGRRQAHDDVRSGVEDQDRGCCGGGHEGEAAERAEDPAETHPSHRRPQPPPSVGERQATTTLNSRISSGSSV